VKRTSKQLFSCTCFSLNQHGGIGRSNLTYPSQYRRKWSAAADDFFKIMIGLDLLNQTGTFPFELTAELIDLLKCKIVLQRKGELRYNQVNCSLVVLIKRA